MIRNRHRCPFLWRAQRWEDVEREAILRMLDSVGDNKSEAAKRLGISRKTLHTKLKRYGQEQD